MVKSRLGAHPAGAATSRATPRATGSTVCGMSRSARRREQLDLAAELRRRGLPPATIATTLRDRYGVNARVAMRLACGWSQADVAAAWCTRWPDDPKTFKNISYWENWPSSTGYAPSLAVLDRLAQLYRCDVADLLPDWGTHGAPSAAPIAPDVEAETLAWQVGNLDLPELTRATSDWARRLPEPQRRTLLLKLSTAASVAAGRSGGSEADGAPLGRGPSTQELTGWWISQYRFHSTGRQKEFTGEHRVELRSEEGRLSGRSEPTPTGSLELELCPDGLLVTGTWTERTAASGYYGGAVYHGILQLVLDPTGRFMDGRWLGPDRNFTIDSGPWTLRRELTDDNKVVQPLVSS